MKKKCAPFFEMPWAFDDRQSQLSITHRLLGSWCRHWTCKPPGEVVKLVDIHSVTNTCHSDWNLLPILPKYFLIWRLKLLFYNQHPQISELRISELFSNGPEISGFGSIICNQLPSDVMKSFVQIFPVRGVMASASVIMVALAVSYKILLIFFLIFNLLFNKYLHFKIYNMGLICI